MRPLVHFVDHAYPEPACGRLTRQSAEHTDDVASITCRWCWRRVCWRAAMTVVVLWPLQQERGGHES